MLSGGIDSGILASYMPKGTKAYTVNNESDKSKVEVDRAKKIAEINRLDHTIIDVTWDDYKSILDDLSMKIGYPVFGNHPQIYFAVKEMIKDGVDLVIFGDAADSVFGGYDQLLSKDWRFEDFVSRFMFVNPNSVLKNPYSMVEAFEKYRVNSVFIDFESCIRDILSISTGVAYYDCFKIFSIDNIDPYDYLKMSYPLDLNRVRNGESKYLLRELYSMKYPQLEIPEKIPMTRPMDLWMKDWNGPQRDEFREDFDYSSITGEQKFNIYSLCCFLDALEKDMVG